VALRLAASARPVLGSTFQLVTTNTATALLGVNVLSLTRFDPGIDLTPLGMPGCRQFVGLDTVRAFLPVAGASSMSLTLPGNPAFAGLDLFGQSAAFAPAFNAAGLITSNGLRLHLDVN
jgi:hypothetical protein